jgi:hypothetical protein
MRTEGTKRPVHMGETVTLYKLLVGKILGDLKQCRLK